MSKFFGYLIVFSLFLIPLIINKFWYPRSVSSLLVTSSGSYSLVPIKPNFKFLRTFSSGSPFSFVSLGSGYVALYVVTDSDSISISSISINSNFYIFRRSRLGRLKSVDISDRCLLDILKKIV